MPVKKILVPVRGDGKGENILAHAAAIARHHHAHVEVLHCRARPADMIPYGVVVPSALREQIKRQASELANAEEEALVNSFVGLLPELGLSRTDGSTGHDGATASWHEEEGKMADVIRPWGRLADLIVVAKPDRDRNLGSNTLRAALYHCGRPVLMVPPTDTAPRSVCHHLAIAWNGSMQGSRVVALSLDLLREAEAVTILDGGSHHAATSGEELARYLGFNGVTAGIHRIDASHSPGEVILAEAAKAGADTLVMGAYSHSREHETVFGGATQHVVDRSTMPVVLAH
ncbi:universal stress protein [Limibaculum sp. M0105]|uniref:Universal stress protein n=1 Tax=Thermohalobaculum xanthum TaxID=2753746 RepID=A0A8J7MAP8_9RHOB|nr:universal stress protein [Thermohalobaculum xanthum]MBK0400599.1 universal stress protein [Thermohalobaculum xanthum]